MDRLIVDRKLDSLRRCVERIRGKRVESVAALQADLDLQDVLVLNLTRAVQICADLAAHLIVDSNLPPPETMGQAFERLAQGGRSWPAGDGQACNPHWTGVYS